MYVKAYTRGVSTLPATSKRHRSVTPSPARSRPSSQGLANVWNRGKPNQPGAGAQSVPSHPSSRDWEALGSRDNGDPDFAARSHNGSGAGGPPHCWGCWDVMGFGGRMEARREGWGWLGSSAR